MPVVYPDTRFGYTDKTVEYVYENEQKFATLVDSAGWHNLLSNADGQKVTTFVATVDDVIFPRKVGFCES